MTLKVLKKDEAKPPSDPAILGQIALGYSPMINRDRRVIATRLTLFPLQADAVLDVSQLLEAVAEVWPATGGNVSLNVLSESLLRDLLRARPSSNLMVEVPCFMAADVANTSALLALHARGNTLLIKGRPLSKLPREVLPCFAYSIIDLEEDRRAPGSLPPVGVARTIGHVQAGVRSMDDMEASFERGAVAVLGWPMEDAASQVGRKTAPHDLRVILELIDRIEAEEPLERLESTLCRDPQLAFKLMLHVNSTGFGLPVEITSFRHAITMLGYKKLRRWLALLLATADGDDNMRPVMFAAVRRGMLMEELARASGDDDETCNELFICGVFSLLDKLMGEPLPDLLKNVPVPERVHRALVDGSGPYMPYCELMHAVEAESLFDIRAAASKLLMSEAQMNRATLRALAKATQID
jgi:EAL and modified HD-GYP domain-containing signal transduction protein